MPMKRGNRVAIIDPRGVRGIQWVTSTWIEGRVSSRQVNGWLRVRVRDRKNLIVVRNSPSVIVKLEEPPLPGQAVTTIARFTRGMLARNQFNLQSVTTKLTETKTLDDNAVTVNKVIDCESGSTAMVLYSIGKPDIENKLTMMIYWLQSSKRRIANGIETPQFRVNTIYSMFDCLIECLESI